MKTVRSFIVILLCTICSLILFGCQDRNQIDNSAVDTYESGIILVRFQEDEYKSYVMVEQKYDSKDSSYYYAMRNNGVIPQEYFVGKSPYIQLPDGWLAVDWKWGEFVYKPSNVLISIPWSDVTNRAQHWERKTTIVSPNPLKQWSGVRRSDIDKYLGITPASVATGENTNVSPDYLRPWWASMYQTLDAVPDTLRTGFTKEDYFREISCQDSLQEVFIERLRSVIEKGDVEKIMLFNYD